MICVPSLNLLKSPVTNLFGITFSVVSIVTVTANLIVLVILRACLEKNRSNKILTSLVVADILTGMFVAPLFSWQLQDEKARYDCEIDIIRSNLTFVLIGCSYCTLALTAYDRYMLLTKLSNYSLYMPRRKVVFLITFSWSFPTALPLLRYAGKFQCLLMTSAVYIGLFLSLIVGYVQILRILREKERHLNTYKCNPVFVISSRGQSRGKRINKHVIKLARSITILIGCHFVCGITVVTWAIIYVINTVTPFMTAYNMQILYVTAMLMLTINSSLNPFIYFVKNPEFRKSLYRILGLQG